MKISEMQVFCYSPVSGEKDWESMNPNKEPDGFPKNSMPSRQ